MESLLHTPFDDTLPALPLRNMMLFPGIVGSVTVGRDSSLKVVNQSLKHNSLVAVLAQKDAAVEEPDKEDLYEEGVLARVMRTIDLPNGNVIAILQSYGPLRLEQVKRRRPTLRVAASPLEEVIYNENDEEFKALVGECRESVIRYLGLTDGVRTEEAIMAVRNISHPVFLINFICVNMTLTQDERYELLKEHDLKLRAYALLKLLNRECQFAIIKREIQDRTREDLDQRQREYFLQEQIKNLQNELGEGDNSDVADLEKRAAKLVLPPKVEESFKRELDKLRRINPQAPDYTVQLNYLQTVVGLPWGIYTEDNLNIKNAERVLNRDHYGMERVKERILEYLATLRYRKTDKAPIVCLYGPPGVGKTSLGRSIAEALNRKYVRISLGGMHDESEIRGHRRTYIGAMPGRIVKGIMKGESANPLFVLDEIDKVSSGSYNGDPYSALLEVLDPEQNNAFHDNYLDLDFDLSKVFFIATANNLQNIPAPLLDRMELIEVSGYITEEKIEIARRHLIPKEMEKNGLKKEHVKFSKAATEYIIENYTRESGVRELEKKISKVMRKIALEIASDEFTGTHELKPKDIEKFLGAQEYSRDKYQGNEYAGVVTGLAWTAVGGEILFVETSLSRGKGQLTLTGNLGSVMKESAMLALEYLKAHSHLLDLPEGIFDNWNIHIHVPEGAIPKDGPSAGITMVTSLASALTQRKVKANLAMTGEITLRGKVLPVGGIREKILAAKRAGIKDIILCEENRKDINEIQPMYLTGMTFHYVKDIKEVLRLALTDEKVADAIDFTIKEDKNKENPAQ